MGISRALNFLTNLALAKRSVTILIVFLVLGSGLFAYKNLERELFPEIEFPNIFIVTLYPSANSESVMRDVTEPIEEAIENLDGIKDIQSTSSNNLSSVQVTFEFGEDMKDAERAIQSSIGGLSLPPDVKEPQVARLNNNTFPVLQLSVRGDRDIPSLQRIVAESITPQITKIPGIFSVDVLGEVDEQVNVEVDNQKLKDSGLSLQGLISSVTANNNSFSVGEIDHLGKTFPIRSTYELGSMDDLVNLPVGFEPLDSSTSSIQSGKRRRVIRLGDVAAVSLGTADSGSISRTNGGPSLTISVIKEPDANTVSVTNRVLQVLENNSDLPSDVEVFVLQNDGPEVERQLSNLLREGLLGFLFAMVAVFVFLINTKPNLFQGMRITLRPTAIIGISIPLSVLTGVVIMGLSGLSLNFMSLAGLAIAVGRVVDDSIVVLENTYRHLQLGESRIEAAINGTREVGAAIVSSTLTTVVVFVPLAFIQGLVGEFFTPFALAVSYALLASTLVALTVVPVLAVIMLREGDFPDDRSLGGDTLIQRIYTPILRWSLQHAWQTLAGAMFIVIVSLSLLFVIPITFFPGGTPKFITMNLEMPLGSGVKDTFDQVMRIEGVLQTFEESRLIEVYQVTLGSASDDFGPGAAAGDFTTAGFFLKLADDVPSNIATQLRSDLDLLELDKSGAELFLNEISGGPPSDALAITVTGNKFSYISDVSGELERKLSALPGLVNVGSDISQARDEITIRVNPVLAAEFGLSTTSVGQQIQQMLVGQTVTTMDLDGESLNVVVMGNLDYSDDIDQLKNMDIEGSIEVIKLGSITDIAIEQGPVSISRYDLKRSANITGDIIGEDTRAVGQEVENIIAELDLPPSVTIKTGGIFEQINEGFQDIFIAMVIGVVLVYLVMVATLGSIRDPFIIVLSLPLAIVGALAALTISDRTLSLSALMGFLLLIGVVVTNAIVLITFVKQLRDRGMDVYSALIEGGRTRVRPILMTAFTTTLALMPLAFSSADDGGIIGAELATVVIGGLVSSTFLTLVSVPVLYQALHHSFPNLLTNIMGIFGRRNLISSK